jgi:hypothetical protein
MPSSSNSGTKAVTPSAAGLHAAAQWTARRCIGQDVVNALWRAVAAHPAAATIDGFLAALPGATPADRALREDLDTEIREVAAADPATFCTMSFTGGGVTPAPMAPAEHAAACAWAVAHPPSQPPRTSAPDPAVAART